MWLQSLVGISVVFLALIALSFFIYLFGKVMKNGNGTRPSGTARNEISSMKTSLENPGADGGDDELIAVITAAIMASLRQAGLTPECRIKVRPFNRVSSDAPAWNLAGRNELISK
ncbi:MAG: OadG family protein [Clostridia bacterium]